MLVNNEEEKIAGESRQGLRRLKRRVWMLEICVSLLGVGTLLLFFRYMRIVDALSLITENLRLLGLHLDLLA